MNKFIKAIHIALTAISWGIFILSLIRIAVVWNSLPDTLGIHFASDGEFDVFDGKLNALYPYLVSGVALILCEIAALLSKKIKMGVKVNENGDIKIRTALRVFLDISKLGFSFFFAGVWADCVIRQHPLNPVIPAATMWIMVFSFLAFVIALIVIKIKNPPK